MYVLVIYFLQNQLGKAVVCIIYQIRLKDSNLSFDMNKLGKCKTVNVTIYLIMIRIVKIKKLVSFVYIARNAFST